MTVGVAVCGFGSAVSLLFAGTNSVGLPVSVVAFTRSAATKMGGRWAMQLRSHWEDLICMATLPTKTPQKVAWCVGPGP